MSYGTDILDPFDRPRLCRAHTAGREARRSAGPAPTKFELVLNLKTAKALGLEVPPIAARARRRGDRVKRREFITLLGGAAAAWPLAARAQQRGDAGDRAVSSVTARQWAPFITAFLQGLNEVGFVEGQNVATEQRWAEGQYDRLPAMAADFIQHQVAVIAALTTLAAVAAKAATATTPIVFTTIGDPVQIGLVTSLSRPGGNITGVTYLNVEVAPKLLELLHEVIPAATRMAALVNPTNPNANLCLEKPGGRCAHARAPTARPESQHRARYRNGLRHLSRTAC